MGFNTVPACSTGAQTAGSLLTLTRHYREHRNTSVDALKSSTALLSSEDEGKISNGIALLRGHLAYYEDSSRALENYYEANGNVLEAADLRLERLELLYRDVAI